MYLTGHNEDNGKQPESFVNAVTEIASFETIESAYKNREYDLALYHALQLYNRYPKNAYIISRIGKILTDLYEVKSSYRFDEYVSKFTPNYCDELKLINSFLYNVTQEELGEIAYHFLASHADVDQNEKSHYYLLWKISSLTYRNDLIASISDRYKAKFGSGINVYKYK
jgi:hypothetical protein